MASEQYVAQPRNNGMAIASLVTSIVGWVFFFIMLCVNFGLVPLLAVASLGLGIFLYLCTGAIACVSPISWLISIFTGHAARKAISETGEGGSGMATAGLIMGYIGLGIVVIGLCVLVVLVATGASIPFIDELLRQLGIY